MRALPRRYGLLHKRLEQFTRMLHDLDEGDVQALHRTRVASRRLREILPVLQVDADVARRLGRRLRKVTQRLGAVRELDVLCLLIAELQESGRYDGQALRRLAVAIGDERARARDRLLAKLPMGELHRIASKLDKIASVLKTRHSSRGWQWAVEARVTHRASALKDALIDAGALYVPTRLHVVRIAIKKLRYAREVLAEAFGLKMSAELRTLKRSQDILGRLHDLQVLLDRVRQFQGSLTPPDVTTWRKLDRLMTALEDDCRRLHARFMHQRTAVLTMCDRVAGLKPPAAAAGRAAG
jgi:CHAD domain-containing protein